MCVVDWYWFRLGLRNVCKMEILCFPKKCYQKFVKTHVLVFSID